ncbi:hypothetical protein G9A89_015376 [Geosiphon pyriformis]|nr:hypothetical protein G9A89_015376 [Geosiphon pyriformis]
MHPIDLPTAITHARDFKAAELEVNYAQANYLSLLITLEDAASNKQETNQKPLTHNILPAASTKDELLAAIFSFKLEKITSVLLFSRAALGTKPITAMYTDAKVNVDRTASAKIITADGATKTSISEIDNFPFEVNGIIVPIKTNAILDWTMQELQLKAYQVSWADDNYNKLLPILSWDDNNNEKRKQREEHTWGTTINAWTNNNQSELLPTINWEEKGKGKKKKENKTQPKDGQVYTPFASHYHSHHLFHLNAKTVERNSHSWEHRSCQMKTTGHEHIITANCAIANATDIQSAKTRTCDASCQYTILISDWMSYLTNAKVQGAMFSEILEIKNNLLEQIDIILIPNPDAFLNIETNSEDFYKHYQNLTPTREKQKHSIQYGNEDNSDLDSDPNSETFIVLSDLTKEQELKWFSDNNKDIMSKHTHDTNTGFDLRYLKKDTIKLEPYLCICIDLKIALKIPATTIVQLASKSSLAKRGINIRRGIIDAEYVGNIIAMLQNDSKKAYVIEPNEKIAQTIFLPLVKIAQLVLMENREELGITVRGIQEFGSTGRVDIPVNMVEKKIIDKKKIIFTGQPIFIPSYNQYMVVIERKVKDQNQIFEVEAARCKSGEIGLINLHIPARNYSHIKIPIYNNTGKVIEILEGTIIGHLTTEIEDQPPNPIPDFPQLCEYVNITL